MHNRISKAIFGLLITVCFYAHAQDRTIANPKAVINIDKNTRITILTPQVIRLEWDSTGTFNNYASFVVVNRNLPVPQFTQSVNNGWLVIKTAVLEIRYRQNTGKFDPGNLIIKYIKNHSHAFNWSPGMVQKENLKGTARTLDGFNGDTNDRNKTQLVLEDGLLAKDGWYLLDDSKSLLFDKSEWPWVKQRPNNPTQDWYFIGYGNDYRSALYNYTLIAGKVPLPPRYAFGYWWSRYWKYSDNELRDLVSNFEHYNIPLDVLVIDMDWHKTDSLNAKPDEFGQRKMWTGWTFDNGLFTDPAQFLKWIGDKDLKVTMNLHPASGIAPFEPSYKTFAAKMNFDTAGHRNIPYIGSDKKFMQTLFDVELHPLEKQGINFWWLDWQQWPNDKKIPALNNVWWLNYVFFTEMERNSNVRPMLYHRWGGLGNHRYQIGFSGDAIISWKSLEYQPYFTNSASNVLYDYWSHDIGGHMFGVGQSDFDPELYTRWMQYGALSPIFRTHSSKNALLNKEIWNFKGEYFEALNNSIRLRYTLAPYIYTMARKTYDTGVGICRPMYYDYPDNKEAYDFSRQYQFGDDILVAPISAPMVNGLSKIKVWLPAGNDWFEWNTGTMLKGGQVLEREFSLLEYPIYIKAGAIIPMNADDVKNLQQNSPKLVIAVFPGGVSKTKVYADDGNNKDYDKRYTFTAINSAITKDHALKLTIQPPTGYFKGMEAQKQYLLKLYGSQMPRSILMNGKLIPYTTKPGAYGWAYLGLEMCVAINLAPVSTAIKTEVTVTYNATKYIDINNGLVEKLKRFSKATTALKYKMANVTIPEPIGRAEELNLALQYHPENFYQLIADFNKNYTNLPVYIKQMHLSPENETWYLQALGFK
jgi:alpha-glucosidase (family GH31 glycosyl hydrolase)